MSVDTELTDSAGGCTAGSVGTDPTIQQAADQKQVSTKTIRRAIARGELVAYRIGPRLIRISAESLNAWGRPLQYASGDAA